MGEGWGGSANELVSDEKHDLDGGDIMVALRVVTVFAIGYVHCFAQLIGHKSVGEVVLDEKNIEVFLGSKTEVKAGRPVTAVSKEKILFFDSNGKVIAEQPYRSELTASENAEYMAMFSVVTITSQSVEGISGTGKWEVYNRLGKKTGEIQVPIYPEEYNRIALSDVGNCVVIEASAHYGAAKRIIFYKKEEDHYEKLMVQEEKGAAKPRHAEISSDGQFVILVLTFFGPNGQEEGNEFALYDSRGKQVWRFAPEEKYYNRVFISRDGSCVVVSVRDTYDLYKFPRGDTYFLDRKGQVIKKIKDFASSTAKFSSSGRYVTLVDLRRMMLVETSSGKVLFSRNSEQPQHVDIAESGKIVGFAGHVLVVLLDFDGKRIWETPLFNRPVPRWSNISLSDDGNEICLTSSKEVSILKRQEEYTLVENVALDENIFRFHFGTKTNSDAARPKLAVTQDKIILLNSKGKVVPERIYRGHVFTSENAHYFASTQLLGYRNGSATPIRVECTVYDSLGEICAEVEMRVPPGKYPRVILSNVGNFIEYSEHSTALKLHRKDGESYKEITIPANTETDLHVELANLSANGKFIILAVTSKEDNREDRTKFRLYDANGNRIWEFIPEKKPYFFHPGVIGVSSDGSCGVVGLRTKTESVTYLLRKEGNVITKIPDCWPSQIKFSRSGEHVALVNSSQNRIILVETKTGKTYSVSVGPTLEEFDFAENGRLVGVTTARSVALLDFDGNWIWSMPIQLDTRSTNISMSPNGNEICVTSGNQYFVFKQNRLIR